MQADARTEAIGAIAQKILHVAKAKYEAAPKVILNADQPDPPPLSWHVAFTASQFIEILIRLLTVRKMQVDGFEASMKTLGIAAVPFPADFLPMVSKAEDETRRLLEYYGIPLARPI